MRKVTKEIEIYEYDELDEKAKEKARDIIYNHLNEMVSSRDVENDLYEYCKSEFDFVPDSVDFDISFSQSDYVNFNLNYVFINHTNSIFWKEIKKALTKDELNKLYYFLQKDYDFNIEYNYKFTPDIEVNDTYFYNYEDEYDLLGKELHDYIVKILTKTCKNICEELLDVAGSLCYFDEDYIIEYINDYEYKFTKNGNIFDE